MLVFGRERSGLFNDELELCQTLVNIPAAQTYSSLNPGQAVQVLSYEILMAGQAHEKGEVPAASSIGITGEKDPKDELVTNEQLEGMYSHYLDALTDLNFFRQKKP